jgi:toxin HigB-1
MGIRDCRHKGLKELYANGRTSRIGPRYHRNALLILDFLGGIKSLGDCAGVKDFHELKGGRKGTYSMHVTGNYCITFKWDGEDVYNLDFEDYH